MPEPAPPAPVAIIGAACRTAGADSVAELWQLSTQGRRMAGPIPDDRLTGWPDDLPASLRPYGFLLDGIDRFDAELFELSPRAAAWTDPQHRLMLELSWRTLEDAGVTPDELRGADVGVFAGGINADYRELMFLTRRGDSCVPQGTFSTFLANRISYFYDWRGLSMVVDTACSASLTALVLAVRALRQGDLPLALVGSANIICNGFGLSTSVRGRLLSPSGESVSFDAGADGYIRGEGGGCVLLKLLDRAVADGDRIVGVIRGAEVSHDGRAGGSTAPDPYTQGELILRAAARAGVDPATIGYLEAHGTGTPVGDPVEVHGVVDALGRHPGGMPSAAGGPGGKLWVGSVKSNVGHLEGAAGIVGLIRATQVLAHGLIPPVAGLRRVNPAIDTGGAPVEIAAEIVEWPDGPVPRRAGVSSYGLGGSNAHVLLEQPPAGYRPRREPIAPRPFRHRSHWFDRTNRPTTPPEPTRSTHTDVR
ncbi:acyl transferase domain-containing protein [Allocatelliglobosispora scoriae]|uniref:Acyl transferase domain-containing protein n=1 Tax=Allocatelliglobosispora scoriae TaxID=643052 RepID=A0A841BK85_9ACTN|nr:polyketide synthase [Allocatelliglobosispora scoriae]MBB5867758.1 acyl transferase domain-containing protein [Allocatelliglobosispora scoriae]